MSSDQFDGATTELCAGKGALAMWRYVLDTSDDETFPFVSDGQLLLRNDGILFQRVRHAVKNEFGPWDDTTRAQGGEPCTPEDVERIFGRPRDSYTITRIALPECVEAKDFPAEYHSDVDGDRYVIVDADDFDLSGWSIEVGQDERWRRQAGFGGWTPEVDTRTYRRHFSRAQAWYRSCKGSPWGYLRFRHDDVDYPWSAMVDHNECIVRWIPPGEE